tara:strand:- start:1957 stop:2106 length:150 start_codon:yes stop_codon:yes gene_type:complete
MSKTNSNQANIILKGINLYREIKDWKPKFSLDYVIKELIDYLNIKILDR